MGSISIPKTQVVNDAVNGLIGVLKVIDEFSKFANSVHRSNSEVTAKKMWDLFDSKEDQGHEVQDIAYSLLNTINMKVTLM
jgi:hypothetical protein